MTWMFGNSSHLQTTMPTQNPTTMPTQNPTTMPTQNPPSKWHFVTRQVLNLRVVARVWGILSIVVSKEVPIGSVF